MTAPARHSLDDFNSIPTLDTHGQPIINPAEPLLTVVPLDQFAAVTDDVIEPLIGSPDNALLPAGGNLLMYGDGGAGKTTLSLDALAHIASGQDWLNIHVPQPVRVLLIENEGPRGPFRQKLQAKIDTWPHEAFANNVAVMEDPWGRFTLDDPGYRNELSLQIDHHQSDLVMVGPLVTLGAKGTGTPDDVNDFDKLLSELRLHTLRRFASWLVHHENKAGDVSGAWERYPDSLIQVSAQGNGTTRVHWRKVRWSSTLHNTSSILKWAAGASFQLEEKEDRDLRTEILALYHADDRWRSLKSLLETLRIRPETLKPMLQQLTEDGELEHQKGPEGQPHNALCWRLNRSSQPPGRAVRAGLPEGDERLLFPLFPPSKGRAGEERAHPHETARSDQPGRAERAEPNNVIQLHPHEDAA